MKTFFYADGKEVMPDDVVVTPNSRKARVQLLLEPGSPTANAYSAPNGGIVLKFDDGDTQMWPQANEDMQLVRRGDPP